MQNRQQPRASPIVTKLEADAKQNTPLKVVPFNERAVRFHRSGWKFVHSLLLQWRLNSGAAAARVEFYEMLEFDLLNKRLLHHTNPTPYWIGVSHLTWRADMSDTGLAQTPDMLFVDSLVEDENFSRHMRYCLAVITFSEHTAHRWRQHLAARGIAHVLVRSVVHPTEPCKTLFSWQNYEQSEGGKQVIQIGAQLRRIQSIFELRCDPTQFSKRWLPGRSLEQARDLLSECGIAIGDESDTNRVLVEYVDDKEYDTLLSQNIAFVDLYDASANNAVIECMVRGTPLLARRLPAVVEYLGDSYPLYFDSLEEAADKLANKTLLRETALYMRAKYGEWSMLLSGARFLDSLKQVLDETSGNIKKIRQQPKRVFPRRKRPAADADTDTEIAPETSFIKEDK